MFPHNGRFSALAYMFFSLHYPRPARERLLVVYRFLPSRDHLSTCYFERAGYVPPIATNRKTTFVFLSCTQSQGIFLTGLKCLKCHRCLHFLHFTLFTLLFTLFTPPPTFLPLLFTLFTLFTFLIFYLVFLVFLFVKLSHSLSIILIFVF